MSSATIYQALNADAPLAALLGGSGKKIFPDYAMDVVPRQGRFLILRWGPQRVQGALRRGPEILTVWAHQPLEVGNDYTILRSILARVREVIEGLEQEPGADGRAVTTAVFTGEGGNLRDPGFNTITRTAAFNVLIRMVA